MNIFDNDIFVIGEYVNSQKKEETLVSLINKLKQFDIPILLSGHFPVNPEIQKMVDFYVFDKNNPVLNINDYKKYGYHPSLLFTETNKWRINLGVGSCDYAEWTLLQNAVNFIKSKRKENIHYITYDNLPKNDEYLKEFLLPMKICDAAVIEVPNYPDRYVSFIFSIKTDIAINLFNRIQTKDEYYTINTDHRMFLENVFFRHLNDITSNIYKSQYTSNGYDLALHGSIDGNNITYFLLCDDSDNLYVNFRTSDEIKSINVIIEYAGIKGEYTLDEPYSINDGLILRRNHNEFILKLGKYIRGETIKIWHNDKELPINILELDYEQFVIYNRIIFK